MYILGLNIIFHDNSEVFFITKNYCHNSGEKISLMIL